MGPELVRGSPTSACTWAERRLPKKEKKHEGEAAGGGVVAGKEAASGCA